MLYSSTRKFVFVRVPKTGTTAIENCLLAADPDLRRDEVEDEDGEWQRVGAHATASEVRDIMGARASQFTFIAFLRDPREVVLSKYHFYRSGRASRRHRLFGKRLDGARFRPMNALRVLSAQLLPLSLWARLYPYKSTMHFIADGAGNLLVDRIGRFDCLQEDVYRIFCDFGYPREALRLCVVNRTSYDVRPQDRARIESVVLKRLPQDLALFDRISTRPALAEREGA